MHTPEGVHAGGPIAAGRHVLRIRLCQCGQEDVDDAIGSFGIGGDDRRRIGRVDDASFRCRNFRHPVDAAVWRDVTAGKSHKRIIDCRGCHRERSIHGAANAWRRAGKIDDKAICPLFEPDLDQWTNGIVDAVTVECFFVFDDGIRELTQAMADNSLGICWESAITSARTPIP